jgi:hypothetical protein
VCAVAACKAAALTPFSVKEFCLAKPNYEYQKRQKELEKKRKKEEKRQRKVKDPAVDAPVEGSEQPADAAESTPAEQTNR